MDIGGMIKLFDRAVLGILSVNANVNAAQTDQVLITAVTGKKIRVLSMFCQTGPVETNIAVNTKPAGAGTAVSPTFQNGQNGGAVLPFSPIGWFETNVGEGLSVTTGAGSTTGISILYSLVTQPV